MVIHVQNKEHRPLVVKCSGMFEALKHTCIRVQEPLRMRLKILNANHHEMATSQPLVRTYYGKSLANILHEYG